MGSTKPVLLPLELKNSLGDPIAADLRYLESPLPRPVVVVCHSFMAFREWGFFPHLGEQLARRGFASLVFDFSHNGVEKRGKRISAFERFSRNTFSLELDDLSCVVDFVAGGGIGGEIADPRKLVLAGHSRGGGLAVVHAAGDPRVRALATLSAISTFDRWTDHQKRLWRRDGFLPLSADPAASPLKLGIGLLNDLESNRERLDIQAAAGRIAVPWLIVHGTEDRTVLFREAELLHARASGGMAALLPLAHAGHLYNGRTAGEDGYRLLDGVVATITDWLSHQL